MSFFKDLVESNSVDSSDIKDYSGASFINASGMYELKVKRAWGIMSKGGAKGVHIEYEGEGLLEQDIYVTNKDKQTWYNKNGKDIAMPGYVDMKKLNYILTGKFLTSFQQLETESRIVKTTEWKDVDGTKEKVEVEKEVEFLVSWQGKEVLVGIQMKEKEETILQGDKYVGTGKVASDKDGKPYLEIDVIGYYNTKTKQTANEMKNDKEATQFDKDKDRLIKAPIRALKLNKPTSNSSSASTASSAPQPFRF